MEELRNIFASSCIEAAARKQGCATGEMYRRMKRVGGHAAPSRTDKKS